MRKDLLLLGGAIALTLTGCLEEPNAYRRYAPLGGGGNYAPSQPAPQNYPRPAANPRDLPSQPNGYPTGNYAPQPTYAPQPQYVPKQQMTTQEDGWTLLGETREWHSAGSLNGCRAIEARFNRYGRKVKLADAKDTGTGLLPWICIFEGEDAQPGYQIPPYMRP